MDKGCTVERNSKFIHDASEAGLSIRCTMFKGYPGETASDLEETAMFLEAHGHLIDRIRFNEFSIIPGTRIFGDVRSQPRLFPELKIVRHEAKSGRTHYWNKGATSGAYRRAKARVLRAVYEINKRPISGTAREFDGLM